MAIVDGEENYEISSNQINRATPLSSRPKGGLLAMPFIIANESLERVASHGLHPNMLNYLMRDYNMSNASSTILLQLLSALTNFSPLLGAFLSDSYFGRFQVIAMGSISLLSGVVLLWLTAMIPQAKPPTGESPSAGQFALLLSSFVLMSIGTGGIRPCSIAFGADQLVRNKDDPDNPRILQSYFNWYYVSVGLSALIAVSVVVYLQDALGWKWGFGIPAILMFISVLTFFLGSPLYVKVSASESAFTGLAQVVVVSFKNRSLAYTDNEQYHCSKGGNHVTPSARLRFLNKACVIRDPENDLNPDGSASNPWNLCTVEHVEALKSLVRIIPIWSTGILSFMAITQYSCTVLQAHEMDRHLTPNFQIPPASFGVFTVISLTIWIGIYDRAVVPLLTKCTGQPRGLSYQARMGIGLAISFVAMVVAALVEISRRRKAFQGSADQLSALWLVPQFCLSGLAEAFNAIGQIEFYYSQLPKSMTSVAMALFSLNNGMAGLLGSILVKAVHRTTKDDEKQSWLADDPNKGHYDYFYWLLAIICAANFLYFLLCCWGYGSSAKNPSDSYDVDVVG